MGSDIDRVGTFKGIIEEQGIGASSSGFPQYVVRLKATEKWVDSAEEMEAFKLTEPGWVNWSEYDQYATGYFILMFNDKNNPGAHKPSFHIEALQRAVGWAGDSFATLNDPKNVGKTVMVWAEENEYQGNVSIKLQAIDAADASPNRSLRSLDPAGIQNLDAKFAGALAGVKKQAKPVTAAKAPGKAPPTPPATKPASTPTASPASATTAPPSKTPPTKAPPAKVAAPFAAGACTKDASWEAINKGKGGKSDDDVATAFLAAIDALADGIAEADITNEQWGAIRDHALAALK